MIPQEMYFNSRTGIRTLYGLNLPPDARVAAYVRGTAGVLTARDGDDAIRNRMYATVAQGIAKCKSGYGDVVIVLSGHTETISAAGYLANLVPGTKIIYLGDPDDDYAPTFTFSNAASNWAVDDKNVTIAGLRFLLTGANNITKAITVTAAGFRFIRNSLNLGTGASNDCAIGLSIESGATGAKILANKSRQSGGTCTGVVTLDATTPADDVEVSDNDFQMIGSAAGVGCINVAGASTNVRIMRNTLAQYHASSTAGIAVANAASTGIIADNRSAVLADGTAASTGIVFTSTGSLIRCYDNKTCDEPRASGALSPAACAT